MARPTTACIWLIFALSAVWLIAGQTPLALPDLGLRIDALSVFLALAVTFISGLTHLFSIRYMRGTAGYDGFFLRLTGLTGLVLLVLIADHMLVFWAAWTGMGLMLADLIGHVRRWPEARAAAALTRRSFLIGSAAVAVALLVLNQGTGEAMISAALADLDTLTPDRAGMICVAVLAAAVVQCGLIPAQRWLLSSMTAPTPVSAFMHAGLVNAGGILVVRLAPLFLSQPWALDALFLVGGVSALVASLGVLVQSDVKRALATSTVAQMGFMLLQCGLGFFASAMAHLILHGLYKANLFLGAGSALANAKRPDEATAPAAPALLPGLVCAATAGAAFAWVTGKLDDGWTTGAVLVAFVAVAAAQVGFSLPLKGAAARLIGLPLVVGLAGAAYGAVVLGAQAVLAPLPWTTSPQPLGLVHLLGLAAFALAWGWVLTGRHRGMDRLYVRLRLLFAPAADTVALTRGARYA
ncbi:MAG: proton-conducting transporter membrane subunit [Rhodothalassiaceae bacterium]